MANIKHKFKKNILFYSFLILIVLILVIYSVILLYDDHKKQEIEDDFSVLNQQILLDDLYNSYLDEADSNSKKCEILNNQLSTQLQINRDLYERLRKINKNAIVETDNKLKYLYVLTNIKLWLHYKKINKECSIDNKVSLYFYPEIKGYSIEKARIDAKTKIFENKLSDALEDCNYTSIALPYIKYIPILDQIIKDHNITSSPSAYINGKVYYDVNKDPNKKFYKEIGCNYN